MALRLDQQAPEGIRTAGWRAFQLGVLLLSSSALLAGLSLLLSLTLWRPRHQPTPWSRPEARWLTALSAVLLLGTAVQAQAGALAWLGLFNWLPFFWFFLAARPYLATSAARRRIAFWLCAATVPLVVVGWLQFALGWSTELNALGGLIRWPMHEARTGTSLFDNPNQTAAWLAVVMPFLADRCLLRGQALGSRLLALLLAVSALGSLVLSASRNAISTVLLSWPLSAGRRLRLLVLALLVGYGVLVLLRLLGLHPPAVNGLIGLLVPDALINKLSDMNGHNADAAMATLPYGRREVIYHHAFRWLGQFPLFGVGEQGFASLYNARLIAQFGGEPPRGLIMHAHSLPLEFALSHGLPALLLLAWLIGRHLAQATRRWLQQRLHASDRSWLLAALVLVWLNIWDVPFFDSRLNIMGWMLIAALSQMTGPGSDPSASPGSAPGQR